MYYVAKVEGKRMWDDPKDIAPIIADLEKNKDQICEKAYEKLHLAQTALE